MAFSAYFAHQGPIDGKLTVADLTASSCRRPSGNPRLRPGLIGWAKPVKREELGAFAMCYACPEDKSEGFQQRFLTAIGSEDSYDIPAGRA